MYDALLLGTKRIGHGCCDCAGRMGSRWSQRYFLDRNEILGLTSSMPMHPLPVVINQGVPVTLNSDDPSVFGTKGLSYDFYQVFVSSETTGLITLKQIALDSIEVRHRRSAQPSCSFQFSTVEIEEKTSLWEKRWFVDSTK